MAPAAPSPARVERLHSTRRADWRFLLARPRLGRVVVVGHHEPTLVASLLEVSDEVRIGAPEIGAEKCDVVVAVRPTVAELEHAAATLGAGGWIYVETRGALRPQRRSGALRGVFACSRALRALGFENVACQWHFPDFESCLEVVPLENAAPVSLSLRRRQQRMRTRLQVLAARLALRLRLLSHVVPAASVIASLPERAPGSDRRTPLAEFISRLTAERPDTARAGQVVLVTPRDVTSTSVVAIVLDERGLEPVLVAKMPRLAGAGSGIAREAATLRELQSRRPTDTAPRVLDLASIEGWPILLETALVGETVTPAELRRHPRRCVEDVLEWLRGLPEPGPESARIDELVDLPLQRLERALPPAAPERMLIRETVEALGVLRQASLPAVVAHGDLSHPNLLRLRDGRIGVVDWELGQVAGLPLSDLCFFLGYVAITVRRAHSPADVGAAFDEAFSVNGWARAPLLEHGRHVGLDTTLVPALLVATWARYAAGFVARAQGSPEAAAGLVEGTVSPHALEALRRSPHCLLWKRALATCRVPEPSRTTRSGLGRPTALPERR